MPNWFWGYFFSHRELVEIYLDTGGVLDASGLRYKIHAELQARRSLFNYLMPGTIRTTLNVVDGIYGVTFIIGPGDVELEDMDRRFLSRCWDMFLREPDRFRYTNHPEVFAFHRDGKDQELIWLDYIESDRTAKWYYQKQYYDTVKRKAKAAKAKARADAKAEAEAAKTVATDA